MQKFLSELQRRKVLRVASGYVVAGWVILQVALSLQAAMSLTPAFGAFILGLLIVGFPIALVVSWFFEFTPDGIKRTTPSSEVARFKPQTADFALAAALVLVLAAVVVQLATPPATVGTAAAPKAEPAVSAASIAVLPFADLSPAKDQEYFSQGIAEEILNVLANVSGLEVASRTSSFQFKGQEKIGVPLIAQQLRVRHILEGSVRKAGDTIRITAQLIDAKTDKHLWSQTFDRTITTENIFAIQDEITKAIVGQLSSRIGAQPIAAPAARSADTNSVDAYALYLQGWELFVRRGKANLNEAARVLERATQIDPKFARAWEALSVVYAVMVTWGNKDRDYSKLALHAVENALQLNPNASLALTARSTVISDKISTDADATWEAASADLDLAIQRDPKNATAWLWRGINKFYLGYFEAASSDFLRCGDVDPAYENCRRWLAALRLTQGREDEAIELYQLGLRRGVFNRNLQFAPVYAARGNKDMALTLQVTPLGDVPSLIEPIFRSLTDPTFSTSDRKNAITLLDSLSEQVTQASEVRLLLRDYENIPIADTSFHPWWTRQDPGFLKSPGRKKLMVAWKLPAYWRKHGFPPQCKPVGKDDFECN